MKSTPNATRMELLRLIRRRKMAQRGHKLLKDKLDGLTHQFMGILKAYRKSSRAVYQDLSDIFTEMVMAGSAAIEDQLDAITFSPERSVTLTSQKKNIMGVRIPEYTLETKKELRNYGKLNVPEQIPIVTEQFSKKLKDLVKLAQSKKAIELIAKEIYDVKRRVNALEFVLLPELDSMVEYIKMKLEEMERSSRVALIKVKEAIK
ncbi:V-type ATP synthase subunit D [Candidatus Margulisiibacteriota bacterium]